MKNLFNEFIIGTKGAVDVASVIFDVVLLVALIPVIKTFISQAQNLTATEVLLLSLVTLFLVLGLIIAIGKQTGMIKSKK